MQKFLSRLRDLWSSVGTKVAPPIQNAPGLHIYPEPIPFFRFATASVTVLDGEPLVDVVISHPGRRPRAGTNRRIVEQTYVVQVPEIIDDSTVNVTLEERVRHCEVELLNSQLSPEDEAKKRFEFYSISVPYTWHNDDGIKTNRYRLEFHKYHAALDERVIEFSPNEVISRYKIDQLNCYSIHGKPLTSRQVLGRLKTERPVVLVNDAKFITTYFSGLLKSKSIFIVPSEPGQAID